MQSKYSMIKEELPEENAVITFSPSIISKLPDTEISLRDQIFSTVHSSDFLLSYQYPKPRAFKARKQKPKYLEVGSKTSKIYKMSCILQSLLAIFLFEQELPTLYVSQIISELKFHFFTRGMCSLCLAAVGNYT